MAAGEAMSNAADDYLAAALAIMEQHAMHRDRIDWAALRVASARRAAGAATPADTYDAIRWALTQLEDGHSFFNPPERGDAAIASGEYVRDATVPSGHLRADRIAYLQIPGFIGSAQLGTQYADAFQRQIAEMAAADPVGWMVDLTENWGGNMWPMLAGLGPLLGEGPLGSFEFPQGPPAIWSYRAGQAWLDDVALAQASHGGYRLRTPARPVALLMSARTASSGEAVLIAFIGRPNTRRFGTATRGLTTANDGFPMPDGATLMVNIGTFADRFGCIHGEAIEPDQYVDADGDQVQTHAAAWIHAAGRAEESVQRKSAAG
jgi:carboxyl-terminal processing protease